ncbi:hypothetical protein BDQ12DRAFT_674700, partial [Crucibulum laeve]
MLVSLSACLILSTDPSHLCILTWLIGWQLAVTLLLLVYTIHAASSRSRAWIENVILLRSERAPVRPIVSYGARLYPAAQILTRCWVLLRSQVLDAKEDDILYDQSSWAQDFSTVNFLLLPCSHGFQELYSQAIMFRLDPRWNIQSDNTASTVKVYTRSNYS